MNLELCHNVEVKVGTQTRHSHTHTNIHCAAESHPTQTHFLKNKSCRSWRRINDAQVSGIALLTSSLLEKDPPRDLWVVWAAYNLNK